MSMEMIEKVTQAENEVRERRAAAEAEAKQLIADAERGSLALLQQVRADAVEDGKAMLAKAEESAAKQAETILLEAKAESAALREKAEKHMEEAVALIVGRVVKH